MTIARNGRRSRRAHRKRLIEEAVKKTATPTKRFSTNGVIIWKGKSVLDGQPIMAVATGFKRSKNRKTGALIQIWIMRSDQSPMNAAFMGDDKSICGDCKHRPAGKRNRKGWGTCYVVLNAGPSGVWGAYSQGFYREVNLAESAFMFKDRRVRLGAYGDPAALPFDLVEHICMSCERHTGYTHQWSKCDQRLRKYVMASADTPEEAARAEQMGWRVFRVRMPDEPLLDNERVCPASIEAGKKATCAVCMACHGAGKEGPNTRANIAIIAHGGWKTNRFIKLRVLQRNHKPITPVLNDIALSVRHKDEYKQKDRIVRVKRDGFGRVIRKWSVALPVINR